MRANEEALRATNLDCLGRATKIHGDIFVSNAQFMQAAETESTAVYVGNSRVGSTLRCVEMQRVGGKRKKNHESTVMTSISH